MIAASSMLASVGLLGCTELTIAWADLDGKGPVATPALFLDGRPTLDDWRTDMAPAYRTAFAEQVYGVAPVEHTTAVEERQLLDEAAFNDKGLVVQFRLKGSVRFGDKTIPLRDASDEGGFHMTLVTPKQRKTPAPVILMETFCPRWAALPHPDVARPDGAEDFNGPFSKVATYFFGRYICTPPIEMILDAGYAIATFQGLDVVPDNDGAGLAELKRLALGHDNPRTRWGAIAAWALVYSMAIDALEAEASLDQNGFIAWGHSRYGKAALLAAVRDDRIRGVIAHQSGTGGASLNRRKKGESIKSITKNYPHWFAPAYAAFAGREEDLSVDQHILLALVAPRPVFLGNARRDVWSDPNGAFRAARGANPAFEIHGMAGLTSKRLNDFRPNDDIAFWIRPGTHGVTEEDWPAFLSFLDAHFALPHQPEGIQASHPLLPSNPASESLHSSDSRSSERPPDSSFGQEALNLHRR